MVSRKSLSNERIIFMFVVMKGHVITIVRINSGKGDDWAAGVRLTYLTIEFGSQRFGFA